LHYSFLRLRSRSISFLPRRVPTQNSCLETGFRPRSLHLHPLYLSYFSSLYFYVYDLPFSLLASLVSFHCLIGLKDGSGKGATKSTLVWNKVFFFRHFYRGTQSSPQKHSKNGIGSDFLDSFCPSRNDDATSSSSPRFVPCLSLCLSAQEDCYPSSQVWLPLPRRDRVWEGRKRRRTREGKDKGVKRR